MEENILAWTLVQSIIAAKVYNTSSPLCVQEAKNQHTWCGGLNMLGSESGNIWRCGLVGVGVSFLEKVCHCGFVF